VRSDRRGGWLVEVDEQRFARSADPLGQRSRLAIVVLDL
jgi:hypothetical protein